MPGQGRAMGRPCEASLGDGGTWLVGSLCSNNSAAYLLGATEPGHLRAV